MCATSPEWANFFAQVDAAALQRTDLLVEILPGGHREGREYRCGDINGGPGQSFAFNTDTGIWVDFATGEPGGVGFSALYARVKGLKNGEGAIELGRILNIAPPASSSSSNSNSHPPQQSRPTTVDKPPSAKERKQWEKQRERWWDAAQPIQGTRAETYLRTREVDVDYSKLETLKFLPDAPYFRDGQRESAGNYPCLVGAVCDLGDNPESRSTTVVGVHRIWLTSDGKDKAPEKKPKKSLGVATYGIRLSARKPLIRIAEGIETILSVATAKGLDEAQYIAASAGMLGKWEVPPWCGVLEIYADGDEPGRRSMERLAVAAKLAGRRVVMFCPPDGQKDFNDVLCAGGVDAVRAIEGVERAELTREERKKAKRPIFDVTHYSLEHMTELAWKALVAYNKPPQIFRGHTTLVRVEDYLPRPLSREGVRFELAKAARWEKQGRDGGAQDTQVPKDICENILEDPRPPLPKLARVMSHWVIDATGRFLVEPGFDSESRIFLAIPERFEPTEMTVEEAVDLFDDLLCDFIWRRPFDRAHAFALMLLPFVREYIRGETPIHVIEAGIQGTGKGLLARVLLSPAGVGKSFLPATKNFEEFNRRLEGMLLSYREAVIIDNIVADFDSETLASMLTAPNVDIRKYYTQINFPVEQRLIWVVTVNNPQMGADLERRGVRIRIISDRESPFLRQDFKEDELVRAFELRRHQTASAAWTIVHEWVAQGCPEGSKKLGSFPHWAKVMGGILQAAKIEHFLEREEGEGRSQTRADLANFIRQWSVEHGSDEVLARNLVTLAMNNGIPVGRSEHESARAKYLTEHILLRAVDQVFEDEEDKCKYRLESHNTKTGLRFKVTAIGSGGKPLF